MAPLPTPPLVLLTEDNGLVGLDLRDALEEAGYRVAGPFGKAGEAVSWLRRDTADLAVVDLQLADGSALALAGELRARGIAFLVHSGRGRGDPLAKDLQDVPWLEKPAPAPAVVAALVALRAPDPR